MRKTLCSTIALLFVSTACPASAQDRPLAKPDLVLQQIAEGMPRGERQEVRVLTATLQPGDRTPFHTHRAPVTAYVLEGTFTLELEGRETVTANAGQAIVEPPNVRMTGYNRGTVPMKVLIFYVSDPGTPFLDVAHH